MPPKYENKLYFKIANTTEEIIKWIRLSTRHDYDHNLLKTDIEKLKDRLHKQWISFIRCTRKNEVILKRILRKIEKACYLSTNEFNGKKST